MEVEISKRLVLVNSASSVAARLVNVTVLFWLHQHLLKRVPPQEYAIYPVVLAVMAFAPVFTTVFTGGISRYVVDAYARGDRDAVVGTVSSIFPVLVGCALVFLGGGLVFARYADTVLNVADELLWDARLMLLLMFASVAVEVVLTPYNLGMYVRQKFVLLNLIQVGMQLVRITILFALLFGVSTRVLWVVVATVSATLLAQIPKLLLSRRLVPELKFSWSHFTWARTRELVSFGFWVSGGQIAHTILTNADPIILNRFATPTDVGAFHVGSMFDRQIRQMNRIAGAPILPMLTAMHATGASERLRRAYLRGARYTLWVVLLMGVPLVVFREEFVNLYAGSRYASAATVILLLLGVYPIGFANVMLSKLAIAMARVREYFTRTIFIQVLNLGLTLYLVGVLDMGAVGSALSTFCTSVGSHVLLLWPLAMRLTGLSFGRAFRETVVPGCLPGAACAVVCLFLRELRSPDSWPWLVLWGAVGATAYMGALLGLSLRPEDRKDLGALLRKLRGKVSGRTSDQKV